jgi:hypothetical protein
MRHMIPSAVGLPIAGIAGYLLGNMHTGLVWRASGALLAAAVIGVAILLATMLWFEPEQAPIRRPVRF